MAAVNSASVYEKRTVSVHIIPLKIQHHTGGKAFCRTRRYERPGLPIARTKYFSYQFFVALLS